MTISVIIPCYNSSAHIKRAIDSVLSQSHSVDEIIAVNDGSTDKTEEILKSYEDKIIHISQANAGASSARNKGIECASSDYIAFLDADDYWYPNKIEEQMTVLKSNKDIQWCGCNYILLKNEQDILLPLHDRALLQLENRQYFNSYLDVAMWNIPHQTSGMIIKNNLLKQAGAFDTSLKIAEDVDLWWRISLIEPKFGYVKEPLYKYVFSTPDSLVKNGQRTHYALQGIDKLSNMVSDNSTVTRYKFNNYASETTFRLLLAVEEGREILDTSLSSQYFHKYVISKTDRFIFRVFKHLPTRLKRKLGGRIRDLHRKFHGKRYSPD